MTRIFTEGAEMGDVLFWTYSSLITTGSVSPAPFASGYYYRDTQSGVRTAYKYLPAALSECYFRVRYYNADVEYSPTNRRIPAFYNAGTELAYLSFTSAMHWAAYSNTGLLADSGIMITNNLWYLVEIYFKLADAPNGRFVVKVDGNIIIDFTGDTKGGADTTFNRIHFASTATAAWCFDDLALNDTSGTIDNSWCGDGVVVKITPSGSGLTNQFLNSGSVSGSANYLYVDEYPHDSDTTVAYCSASNVGFQDQYAMSSFIGTGKTIRRIYSEARARKTIADESSIKIGYLPEGGTDQLSGSVALTTSYVVQVLGTSASANPVTGLAWTEQDINGLEFVAEI